MSAAAELVLDDATRIGWTPQPGPQSIAIRCPVEDINYGGARGGGKALVHGEPVLTPWGEKPIEECAVGDQVLNPDGTTARIIGVYPQPRQVAYRVCVDDGSHVDVTADHLWLARVTGRKLKADRYYLHDFSSVRWRVWTTAALIERLGFGVRVPLTQPVNTQAHSKWLVESDPYVIGLMIGDGTLVGSLRFTSADEELQVVAAAVGFKQSGRPIEFFCRRDTQLAADLSRLGLMGKRAQDKFVPYRYLYGGTEERRAVLQGLLDTDGYADDRGHIEFSSASKQLSLDVQHLVRSLGGKATLSEKPIEGARTAWKLYIRHAKGASLFRLHRKRARCEGRGWNGGHEHTRKILSIEELGEREATCIKVDHPNGLFLTRGHIVTHNTDWILMDWVHHQQQYGSHASGLLFRKSFEPEMREIIRRSHQLYPPLGARWVSSTPTRSKTWLFPNGSEVAFRHMEDETDADNYIGHQYTWVGFDQLERWSSPDAPDKIRGSMRSPYGIPCVFRSTSNPGGKGHQWVKERYRCNLVEWYFRPFWDAEKETERVFIPAKVRDNPALLENDPNYVRRIRASGPRWLVEAWLDGNWDIVPGAYLEDIWDPNVHRIKPFTPPVNWKRWRALDWGFARPYSVGWYAMDHDGVIYRYRELYGWSGRPDTGTRESAAQVAKKIRLIEASERAAGCEFVKNPAGVDIWGQVGLEKAEQEETIAKRFREHKVIWQQAQAGPGSRILGAQELIGRLYDQTFFVTSNCKHWLRTVPVLMPDEKNPEDVDTEQEDHAYDECRYSLRSRRVAPKEEHEEKGPQPGSFDHLVMMDERRKRAERDAATKRLRRLS